MNPEPPLKSLTPRGVRNGLKMYRNSTFGNAKVLAITFVGNILWPFFCPFGTHVIRTIRPHEGWLWLGLGFTPM